MDGQKEMLLPPDDDVHLSPDPYPCFSMPSHKLLVGDPSCTYEGVVTALKHTSSHNILRQKFVDLSLALDVSQETTHSIQISRTTGTLTFDSELRMILEGWRSKHSTKATLHNLLLVLKRMELNDCADILHARFCNGRFRKPATTSLQASYHTPLALNQTENIVIVTNRTNTDNAAVRYCVQGGTINRSNSQPGHPESTSLYSKNKLPGSAHHTRDALSDTRSNEDELLASETEGLNSNSAHSANGAENNDKGNIDAGKDYSTGLHKENIFGNYLNIGMVFVMVGGCFIITMLSIVGLAYLVNPFTMLNKSKFFNADLPDNNFTLHCIRVATQEEYNEKMANISISLNDKVVLHINLKNALSWKDDFVMIKPITIKEIYFESAITTNAIVSILRQVSKNVEVLNLINDSHDTGLCSYTNAEIMSNLNWDIITLENLQSIYFFGSPCSKLFSIFAKFIHTPVIQDFVFYFKSNVEGAREFIEKLFRSSKNTLNSVTFSGEHISDVIALFSLTLPKLLGVTKVSLQTNGEEKHNLESKNMIFFFDRVFPQVKILDLNKFIVPFNSYLKLLEMKDLVELKVGVEIEGTSFPLSSVPSRIKYIDLFLSFDPDLCNTSGSSVLPTENQDTQINIASNCPISADTPILMFG